MVMILDPHQDQRLEILLLDKDLSDKQSTSRPASLSLYPQAIISQIRIASHSRAAALQKITMSDTKDREEERSWDVAINFQSDKLPSDLIVFFGELLGRGNFLMTRIDETNYHLRTQRNISREEIKAKLQGWTRTTRFKEFEGVKPGTSTAGPSSKSADKEKSPDQKRKLVSLDLLSPLRRFAGGGAPHKDDSDDETTRAVAGSSASSSIRK
ncbi:hypothetical protein V8F33_014048 [Rhypophila sp. PSN 637]